MGGSRLLQLPAEIRELIYSEVLQEILQDTQCHLRYRFDLALLRTCKQIRLEASRRFHLEHNFVAIETPWEGDTAFIQSHGMFPIVAEGDAAYAWPQTRMSVVVDAPILKVPSVSKFIMLAQDMDKFCKHWFYQSLQMREMNSHLRMRIRLSNLDQTDEMLPLSKQTMLLQHFSNMKELGCVEFTGADADLAESTKEAMSSPMTSPTECLEMAIKLKDEGNNALKMGKFTEAIELYKKSFLTIHIVIEGRSRVVHGEIYFDTILTKRLDNDFVGRSVYFKLRVRLVANMMLALIRLREFAEAEYWGLRSITLLREVAGELAERPNDAIPGAVEWGKIYYRTGIAAEELNKPSEARDYYRIASAWMPYDPNVREAVSRTMPRLG